MSARLRRTAGAVLAGGLLLTAAVAGWRHHGAAPRGGEASAPSPEADQAASGAEVEAEAPPPSDELALARTIDCGPSFAALPDGRCAPVDPATGGAYDEERLREFDAMRATPFVASKNYFVPRVMTEDEARTRRDLFARMNVLREKIRASAASEAEIEDFFSFRGQVSAFRLQLLTYAYAQAGGKVSSHDPALDPESLTDPDLLAKYRALDQVMKDDYEQKLRARREAGLVAEVLDNET